MYSTFTSEGGLHALIRGTLGQVIRGPVTLGTVAEVLKTYGEVQVEDDRLTAELYDCVLTLEKNPYGYGLQLEPKNDAGWSFSTTVWAVDTCLREWNEVPQQLDDYVLYNKDSGSIYLWVPTPVDMLTWLNRLTTMDQYCFQPEKRYETEYEQFLRPLEAAFLRYFLDQPDREEIAAIRLGFNPNDFLVHYKDTFKEIYIRFYGRGVLIETQFFQHSSVDVTKAVQLALYLTGKKDV